MDHDQAMRGLNPQLGVYAAPSITLLFIGVPLILLFTRSLWNGWAGLYPMGFLIFAGAPIGMLALLVHVMCFLKPSAALIELRRTQ